MNIGIDISQIVYKGSGVARFTEGLVNAILKYDTKNYWTFFFSSLRQTLDTDIEKNITSKGHTLIKWKIPPTLLSFLWNDLHEISGLTTNVQRLNKLDWFITSDWTEPKMRVKKATIVHDLVFKRFPETVHSTILQTQQKRLEWIAKESTIIFTDSESTASDLKEFYPDVKGQIVINYPGIDVNVETHHDASLQNKYNITKPFILSVGKLEPRKNTQRLIDAFNNVTIQQSNNLQLVIVGPTGWGDTSYTNNDKIKFLGYVPDDELATLYKTAQFFVYPSLYEGFGYPIVEAMKCGCPVATSDTSSLKEIADDSALLFDPHDTKSITQAIQRLSSDEALRSSLSEKGKKRAESFTWEKYYNTLIETLSVIPA